MLIYSVAASNHPRSFTIEQWPNKYRTFYDASQGPDLAADLIAKTLAAAAEKVVTDKATTRGAAAAAPPPDNEPAAADAAETSEQQTDPPRKHRGTKSGERNTDDDMSDTGLEDKQT